MRKTNYLSLTGLPIKPVWFDSTSRGSGVMAGMPMWALLILHSLCVLCMREGRCMLWVCRDTWQSTESQLFYCVGLGSALRPLGLAVFDHWATLVLMLSFLAVYWCIWCMCSTPPHRLASNSLCSRGQLNLLILLASYLPRAWITGMFWVHVLMRTKSDILHECLANTLP